MANDFAYFVLLSFLAFVRCQEGPSLNVSEEVIEIPISSFKLSGSQPIRSFQLSGPEASVTLSKLPWAYTGPLIVELKVQTRSYSGQIFTLVGSSVDGTKSFHLLISIERRLLSVVMKNGQNEVVADLQSLTTEISDGRKHKIIATLNILENAIAVDLDRREERQTISGALEVPQSVDLALFLGYAGDISSEPAFSGCVTDLRVFHAQKEFNVEVSELSGRATNDQECPDPCSTRVCNAGVCRNLFNGQAVCDCVGSGKEGANCDKEETIVSFATDQYLEYILPDSLEDRQIQNLSISFKTKTDQEKSVLLYMPITSTKDFILDHILARIDKSGVLTVNSGDEFTDEMSFIRNPVNDGNWHRILFNFNYGSATLAVTLDSESLQSQWKINPDDALKMEKNIYIGGIHSDDSDLGQGFIGCLKNVYDGTTSLLSLLKEGNSTLVKTGGGNVVFGCSEPIVNVGEISESEGNVEGKEDDQFTGEQENPEPTTPEEEEPPISKEKTFDNGWVGPKQGNCNEVQCMNGASCIVNGRTYAPECHCNNGFSGRFCQFSILPKHCTELYFLGERGNGVYQIDLDGSGPMAPVYVECRFDSSSMGKTMVWHNFPNKTRVRDGMIYEDSVIPVTYRILNKYLEYLMDSSNKCEQYIRYDCLEAPLQFDEKTWFESVRIPRFGQIGDQSEKCPCSLLGSCVRGIGNGACNCDANQKFEQMDEGWLRGDLAGVTSLTILQFPHQERASFTLGPLSCSGTDGAETAVTFLKSDSFLSLKQWEGKSFSFWFRTSSSKGLLLKQDAFEIWINEGHVAELKMTRSSEDIVLRSVSQGRLNDSAWHKILLEYNKREIRFSVDTHNEYRDGLPEDLFQTFTSGLTIGGAPNEREGFVGCIREVSIDGVAVDLRTKISGTTGVTEGCPNNCSPSPCRNNAECAENFEIGTYRCICKNPWAHLGRDCQINVNQGSEVSFHDKDRSFITYRDLPANPVTQATTFSFRTDQSSALLSYALDENYNFVETHLWDDNKLTLTLNYNRSIYQCTVSMKDRDLSDMEWNQVTIRYEKEYTALFVDYEMCIVNGSRILSDSYIDRFELGASLINVFPPRSPSEGGSLDKYTLLYVGGVQKPPSRGTFFYTDLPSLLGCLRGLQIANTDLRSYGYRSGDVKDGCNTAKCDSLVCDHGGHCTVNWEGSMDATCDCSKTSFSGPECHEDVGAHFDGNATLQYDMGKLLNQRIFLPQQIPPSTLSFAFSTTSSGRTMQMAFLKIKDSASVDVFIKEEGTLDFELYLPGIISPMTVTFPGNYTDGNRHFVFMKFKGTLEVTVDGVSKDLNVVQRMMDLTDVQLIVLGGSGKERLEPTYLNYAGCISNAIVDFRLGPRFVFKPILYLVDPESAGDQNRDTVSVIPEGAQLHPGACAQYTMEIPIPAPSGTLPPWNAPLVRNKYVPPTQPGKDEEEGGGGGIIAVIILAILLIVVVFAVVGYLWYVKCYKNREPEDITQSRYQKGTDVESPPPKVPSKEKDPSATNEEKTRLRPEDDDPELNLDPVPIPNDPNTGGSPLYSVPHKPHPANVPVAPLHVGPLPSHMDVPEATESLDEPSPTPPLQYSGPHANRGSLSSESDDSSYVTSQTEFPPPPTEEELTLMSPEKNVPQEFTFQFPPKFGSSTSPTTPSRKLVYVPPPRVN